jgi:hypothetical protein
MDMNRGFTQIIVEECRKFGCLRNQAAYILATAYWETGRSMQPIKETVMPNHKNKNPSDATVKKRLTSAWRRGKLPWVKSNYWSGGYFGRGFVQLTHEYNYKKAGQKLGVDFVANPDLVMDPKNSAAILIRGSMDGWFTGKKIPDYITLKKSDFEGARRVINGTDKKRQIADLAKQYDKALEDAGYGVSKPKAKATPVAIAVTTVAVTTYTFWDKIEAFFAGWF